MERARRSALGAQIQSTDPHMTSLYDVIRSHADSVPDKLAIISELDGERSYSQLAERGARLGHALAGELGLGVGERVCVWMVNRPEWVDASVACAAAGLPTVPTNPEWTDGELEFVLRHSRSRAVVCDTSLAERALQLRGRIEGLDHVIVVGEDVPEEARPIEALIEQAPADAGGRLPEIPDFVPGQLMYTSGTTTGRPKAVQMAREMLLTSVDYEEMFGCGASDRSLFVTPLFHGNGSGGLTCTLRYGGSAVFQRRFSASSFWNLVDRTRPSLLFTLAPIVNILLGLPPSPFDRQHGMRLFVALGSGPNAEVMEERYGVPVIDWYGMTEAGSGTYTRLDEERRPGSAGRPFEGSAMAILREDGSRCETGETGEVCFHAESIGFNGYVEDREATDLALTDGYFHTGDLGYFDRDGYFFFVDRIKDIVRRGGENISSLEVESYLRSHPKVADIAIVGKPDPVLGERLVAFVAPTQGTQGPSAADLAEFAAGGLAQFKIPEEVHAVDELPRTPTGKIQKFKLRELL